jgi:hypothetical protein
MAYSSGEETSRTVGVLLGAARSTTRIDSR